MKILNIMIVETMQLSGLSGCIDKLRFYDSNTIYNFRNSSPSLTGYIKEPPPSENVPYPVNELITYFQPSKPTKQKLNY